MRWLRSIADFAVDFTAALVLGAGALLDEWRGEGR